MSVCKHRFTVVGVKPPVYNYIWWCRKCGAVELGGHEPLLKPCETQPLSLLTKFLRWLE